MGILHIYHKLSYLLHFYLRNFRFTERQQQHWKFVVIATYCCVPTRNIGIIWRRHQMETFSELLDLCAGNWLVTGEFPSQRPVTRSFDVFFICAWINDWVNNRDTGDLRRHRAHYYVNVMNWMRIKLLQWHTSWHSECREISQCLIDDFDWCRLDSDGTWTSCRLKIPISCLTTCSGLQQSKPQNSVLPLWGESIGNRLIGSHVCPCLPCDQPPKLRISVPLIGEFPSQRSSDVECFSMSWRHHKVNCQVTFTRYQPLSPFFVFIAPPHGMT